ncbi:MAG: hypothetical protein P1P64_04670 [Treponemataceae bacterium]
MYGGVILKLSPEEKKILKTYIDTDKKEFKRLECQYRLTLIENKKDVSYYKTDGSYLAKAGSDLYIKLGEELAFLKNYCDLVDVYLENIEGHGVYFYSYKSGSMRKLTSEENNAVKKYINADKRV